MSSLPTRQSNPNENQWLLSHFNRFLYRIVIWLWMHYKYYCRTEINICVENFRNFNDIQCIVFSVLFILSPPSMRFSSEFMYFHTVCKTNIYEKFFKQNHIVVCHPSCHICLVLFLLFLLQLLPVILPSIHLVSRFIWIEANSTDFPFRK